MKILALILSSTLLLSACTGNITQTSPMIQTEKIQQLEQENTALQLEIRRLKEDNVLLQAGGDPSTINTTITKEDPSAPKFIEGNFASCMKEAQQLYITQGSDYCRKSGYSTGEIMADQCKLDNSIAVQLKSTKSKMENECKNLYQ